MMELSDAERNAIKAVWGKMNVDVIGPQELARWVCLLIWMQFVGFFYIYTCSSTDVSSCTLGLNAILGPLGPWVMPHLLWVTKKWLLTAKLWSMYLEERSKTWMISRTPMRPWACCTPKNFIWIRTTLGWVIAFEFESEYGNEAGLNNLHGRFFFFYKPLSLKFVWNCIPPAMQCVV